MIRRLLPVVMAALAPSCGAVTEGVRVATVNVLKIPNAGINPALIDEHCPFGVPEKEQTLDHGPTQLVGKADYVLEHDGAAKIALWVCESLDPKYLSGPAERKDNFKPDPDLPVAHRAVDADYKGSGLQRGHMIASEDRVSTQALNDERFFLSNMVPQNGPLNGEMWARLEKQARIWATGGDRHRVEGDLRGLFLRSRGRRSGHLTLVPTDQVMRPEMSGGAIAMLRDARVDAATRSPVALHKAESGAGADVAFASALPAVLTSLGLRHL